MRLSFFISGQRPRQILETHDIGNHQEAESRKRATTLMFNNAQFHKTRARRGVYGTTTHTNAPSPANPPPDTLAHAQARQIPGWWLQQQHIPFSPGCVHGVIILAPVAQTARSIHKLHMYARGTYVLGVWGQRRAVRRNPELEVSVSSLDEQHNTLQPAVDTLLYSPHEVGFT